MQEEIHKIEEIVSHVKQYVNTRITKAKFDAAAKASDLIAFLVVRMALTVAFLYFLIFCSDAAAYAIGDYFNRIWLGFLLVAIGYLLLGAFLWVTREKWLRIPIMNSIIQRLFSHENDSDEED